MSVTIEKSICVDVDVDVDIGVDDIKNLSESELNEVGLTRLGSADNAEFSVIAAAHAARTGDDAALLAWAREELFSRYGQMPFPAGGAA